MEAGYESLRWCVILEAIAIVLLALRALLASARFRRLEERMAERMVSDITAIAEGKCVSLIIWPNENITSAEEVSFYRQTGQGRYRRKLDALYEEMKVPWLRVQDEEVEPN